MPTRPAFQSRQTTTTISASEYSASGGSLLSSHRTDGTALTTPELSPKSPKKGWLQTTGQMDNMLTVMESEETFESPVRAQQMRLEAAGSPLGRGKSVKDRIGNWETTTYESRLAAEPPSTPHKRSLPQPQASYNTNTPPPRMLGNAQIGPSTPTPTRRIPVPASAPNRATSTYTQPETLMSKSARRSPPALNRGTGSAKKMIQQWENKPPYPSSSSPTRRTPSSGPLQPTKRVYSKDYLNDKPLPLPTATRQCTTNAYSPIGRPSPQSYNPSPLHSQHLKTPTRPNYPRSSASPTSPFSATPSPSKGKGKSPLKDMLSVVGNGLKDAGRKMRGKSREKYGSRDSLRDIAGKSSESLHFWEEKRIGTNGLPGGIVLSDRMGDQEMSTRNDEPGVIRTSPVVYLVPTPCSSVASWGSWLPSFAALTASQLRVTYCPVFTGPGHGSSSPRRILSGTSAAAYTIVPFSQIPQPEAGQEPDVELTMSDCVEVRSLRRDEVKGRGIPAAPEGIGTEVLEMVWSDGSKRYLGVEGVGGRLGWVSAIWDVLLASKNSQPPVLPPPSPMPFAGRLPTREMSPEASVFRHRIASMEHRSNLDDDLNPSSAPPVQKVGDTWVAASVLAPSDVAKEGSETDKRATAEELRNSVQRMFDTGPDPTLVISSRKESIAQEQPSNYLDERKDLPPDAIERIKAWQSPPPSSDGTTQHLSIFRARGNPPPESPDLNIDPIVLNRKTETLLSFDPNDLNPSRSASQVRRATTILGGEEPVRRYGPKPNLAGIEEVSDSSLTYLKSPTHISHVTFPKPAVGGNKLMDHLPTHLETIEGSSTDSHPPTSATASSAQLRTPQTIAESVTSCGTSIDHTVLAKLQDHSSEHGTLIQQMDDVGTDVKRVIGTLTSLIAGAGLEEIGSTTKGLEGRLEGVALDVKAIENALNLNMLAKNGVSTLEREETETLDNKMPELHRKLDMITQLCEGLLAAPIKDVPGAYKDKSIPSAIKDQAQPVPVASTPMRKKGSLGLAVDAKEEKEAGEEVAAIMADLTGGSSKTSPRVVGIQVLHNISNPSTPAVPAQDAKSGNESANKNELPADTKKQIGEVLGLVKELKDARSLQTQQTTDIARYLNELNAWLEKFVVNSTKELTTLNNRLSTIVGPETSDSPEEGKGEPKPLGLPDLVADLHAMVTEQKKRADGEGGVGQRLDMLLQMMGAERERASVQQNTVEQVMGLLDRQRQDNEILMRALATDLTSEIRGERLRFVEAMQQATTMNVHNQIEDFKKSLGTEVAKTMQELGHMREEKKALEQNISDLFALKAKHGGSSRHNTKKAPSQPVAPPAAAAAATPAPGRGLPAPPAGRGH